MWSPVDESGKRKDNEYRASRMNLIIHIGFESSVEEAKDLFQSVIGFSHRYPCRLILLCPQPESWDSKENMSCKIFSECVFGDNAAGMSCCEALILGYTLSDRRYLENQVSVFLEADLPVYYWPTRFGSAQLLSDYTFFFKQAQRVIFDSSRECFLVDQVEVSQPEKVHDLSFSRLLPIRQCMGQFLSAFDKASIVDGLTEVTLSSCASFKSEGRALLSWVSDSLSACFEKPESGHGKIIFEQVEADCEEAVPVMTFVYDNGHFLVFKIDFPKGEGRIEADLGNGRQELTTGVRLLDAETALAEALFFS